MKEPWETLRETRLFKSLSLDDISKKTKINKKYLEALENGKVDIFPAEVYLRGFLRIYASSLGLDPEELVSQYEEKGLLKKPKELIKPKEALHEKEKSLPEKRKGLWRRFFRIFKSTKAKLFLIGGIGFILSCIIIGRAVLLHLPKETPPVIPQAANEKTQEKPIPLLLEVKAIRTSWVHLSGNSEEEKSLLLRAGETIIFKAKERIKIRTGNAGGIIIKLNNKELGPLGRRGEVVTKIITSEGILTE